MWHFLLEVRPLKGNHVRWGGQWSTVFLADFHKSTYRLMLVETLGYGIYPLCFMGNHRFCCYCFFWIYTWKGWLEFSIVLVWLTYIYYISDYKNIYIRKSENIKISLRPYNSIITNVKNIVNFNRVLFIYTNYIAWVQYMATANMYLF